MKKPLLLLLCLLAASSAWAASDELWIAAVEGRSTGEVDSTLKPYFSEIQKAFQLDALKLIDTEKEPLEPGHSSLATFKGGYNINVQCLERRSAFYVLVLTLSDREGPILETKVQVARRSPIFVALPATPEGRLLFILAVR